MARSVPKAETPHVLRIPKHGKGKLRVGNPGNAGRHKAYMELRAAMLAADPMVWDVQLARAKAGDIKPLQFAAERAFGKPKDEVEHTGEITIKHTYEHPE